MTAADLGDWEVWGGRSDHVPVVIDVELTPPTISDRLLRTGRRARFKLSNALAAATDWFAAETQRNEQ